MQLDFTHYLVTFYLKHKDEGFGPATNMQILVALLQGWLGRAAA
jgi:hypothetical protein